MKIRLSSFQPAGNDFFLGERVDTRSHLVEPCLVFHVQESQWITDQTSMLRLQSEAFGFSVLKFSYLPQTRSIHFQIHEQ